MSSPGSAVVLGGGLSGAATAYALAREGVRVTMIEAGATVGGLAGSFERDGHWYPLGYHHILHRDRTLHFFLDAVGALPSVRWRRVRMAFRANGRQYDLGSPAGFLHFPMHPADKARFVRMMLRAFRKSDWSDWEGRTAAELVDRWAGPGVRRTMFEPLTRLKFELPCDEVSGAWLGARLYHREGSAPFGCVPGANWTKMLCDGLERLLAGAGVQVRLRAPVARLHVRGDRVHEAELADGERVGADVFASTVPTETYLRIMPEDGTPEVAAIRYTALLSVVCAVRRKIEPNVYWTTLASLDCTAGGIFLLSALNPTIGGPGETCVNFVTHLRGRDRPLFRSSDDELLEAYGADFRRVFGVSLEPFWVHVARVPMYSPVFRPSFRNPPLRSTTWRNVYFGGNYRTFPSIVSTGTALRSGLEAAAAVLEDRGRATDLPSRAAAFRLPSMPRLK